YWTLRPQPIPAPARDPSYGPSFLRQDGSANGALYDSLTALNAELRGLGPTLMRLEPISVHHTAANSVLLPDEKSADLAVGLTGRRNEGMAGNFRGRATGSAYLMVVNKDTLATDTFTVKLAKAPAFVYRVDKRSGRLRSVRATGASFRTGAIRPGSGEL